MSEETLPSGARQQSEQYEFTEFPLTMLALGSLSKRGSDYYGLGNWRGIPVDSHLNHAIGHVYKCLAGLDTTTNFGDKEDHLLQAIWRLIAAYEVSK